jgi:cell division protein FtsB
MDGQVLSGLLKRAVIPVICLAISGYFLSHALAGPTGIFALDGIREKRALLEAERERLLAEEGRLAAEIALLDPSGADPDYADELVRRHLGVARPDELIVPLPDETQAGSR